MDISLLHTCRYTGIRKTSANDSDFRVCRICGGVTHKSVGADRKTAYDLTVNNKVAYTEETIPKTNLLHQEAFRCSHCGEVLENYDFLELLIPHAQALHDGATEGTEIGEYEINSKATLQDAIDEARDLIDADNSSQEEINAAIITLTQAMEDFESGKVPVPDKSELGTLINSTLGLIDVAVEGADPGQYAVGSKATLQSAVDVAQLVFDDETAVQSEVDSAISDLEAAVAVFELGKVPEA